MEIEACRLGRGPVSLSVHGIDEVASHLVRLAEQAQRRLWFFTHRLHPALHARAPLVAAVRRLALSHPRVDIRLLLVDPDAVARAVHPLVDLAGALTSRIAIRRTAPEDGEDVHSYLLADESGFLIRPHWETLDEARVGYSDRARVRALAGVFEEAWVRGEAAAALRRLLI